MESQQADSLSRVRSFNGRPEQGRAVDCRLKEDCEKARGKVECES